MIQLHTTFNRLFSIHAVDPFALEEKSGVESLHRRTLNEWVE